MERDSLIMGQVYDDGVSKFEIESALCERCAGTIAYPERLFDGQIRFRCKRCDFPITVKRKEVRLTWSANLMLIVFFGLFVVLPILWLLEVL